MTKKTNIILTLITLISIVGIFFLGFSATFIFDFFLNPENPLRHEYLEGAILTILPAIPCWLVVSILSFFVQKEVPKSIFIACNLPLMVIGVAFVCTLAFEMVKRIII